VRRVAFSIERGQWLDDQQTARRMVQHARGYSSRDFMLKIRREEVGTYLGLRLETLCRGIAPKPTLAATSF